MTPLCARIYPYPSSKPQRRAPPPDPRLKLVPVIVASWGVMTPDVDIPVHPPRTGVSAAPGARGLGVEEALFNPPSVGGLDLNSAVAARA